MTEYKTLPKRLENFAAKWVPGLRVYLQRENLRDADKAIRDEVVKRLDDVISALNGAKRKRVDNGSIKFLDRIDRAISKSQKVRDTIRFDSRGYQGIFDPGEVGERELLALLDFDQALFETVDSLQAIAEKVASISDVELKPALSEFEDGVEAMHRKLKDRESYASQALPASK